MQFTKVLILLGLSTPVLAITNIEERRLQKDQQGFAGRVELGLDAQAGNNEKRKWSAALNGNWQNDQYRVFSWASRLHETSNGRRTDDDTFFHTRVVRNHRRHWAQEAFVQYERDPFAALSSRALTGAGLRYQQKLDDNLLWSQGTGLFHEWVREEEASGEQSDQLTRLNLYTHLQWQLPAVKLQTTLYFQPVVDEPADQRALWQLAASIPLGSQVELKWQWQSRWDSRPPQGIEKENHQTQLRLGINF